DLELIIKSYDDVSTINFLHELSAALPGFVQIDEMQIRRNKSFSEQNYDSFNPSSSWAIDTKATLKWMDFKDITKDDGDKKSKLLSHPDLILE
ncbi:MAG: hypothetical protein AAF153_02995, partial [Pseudomonadota bacterium]